MSKKDSTHDEDEKALFHAAMRDVAPLPMPDKVIPRQTPASPVPRKTPLRTQQVSDDTLSDHISLEIEAGEEWSFLRPGVSRQTLRRLRRGYWSIQGNLDLHGFTRDEARQELVEFLDGCIQQKFRCIRVIHGKGLSSKDRSPVLKTRIGNWLAQCDSILAFCQARPEEGGGGAMLILLKV